jgi:hypothetical protein
MPKCPYEPHRLKLGDDGVCDRCGRDLRVYAVVSTLPERLYNEAYSMLEDGHGEAAVAMLRRVIALRTDFPEAHWLMAAAELRGGHTAEARRSLDQAALLGAAVDPGWLDPDPLPVFGVQEIEVPREASNSEIPSGDE